MDFQIYESNDHPHVLLERSTNSKNSWVLNMDNDEYFNWTNGFENEIKNTTRKRKHNNDNEKKEQEFKYTKTTLDDNTGQKNEEKKNSANGTSRMPQWQEDDIAELNADIEGSLNGLGAELSNNSYNMSDAILNISGLTVFKQEAPSPTNDVNFQQIARQNQSQNHQNPPHTQTQTVVQQNNNITTISDNNNANILNSTLHQLLGQNGYNNLQNVIEGQENFSGSSSPPQFSEDCRFQYVLAAATSIATKINEDTLTYLNQGQSYEIKLKKLGDLSTYRGKMLRSTIRICFHERRLQYMEKEQMSSWQRARPGDRILEVDIPLSYGLFEVTQPTTALNVVQFNWDPTKEVGVYIKVNCISTEFTPKKHGGEKGVPFRIQVETCQACDGFESNKRLHAAACQIKVFKLKGADRKHKQDREKILKRPLSEREKYQPSYECTVLNDIANEAVVSSPLPTPSSPDSGFNNVTNSSQQPPVLAKVDEVSLSPTQYNNGGMPILNETKNEIENDFSCELLTSNANPHQTANWLSVNRFDSFRQMFANFSGSDMLRMSREDLIQICGQADGIRLYNSLHAKVIIPKLTIYVSRNSEAYHAIYLITLTNFEIIQKLSSIYKVPVEQIKDVFIEGPQSIHVHLTNDVIRHLKADTLFTLNISQKNGTYTFLLKNTMKTYKDVNINKVNN